MNLTTPARRIPASALTPVAIALCAWALLIFGACATGTAKAPPKLCEGGSNAFDCSAFAALATAHDTIEAAKVEFPHEQPTINAAVAAFNLASDAYVIYHAQAKIDPTGANRVELDRALAALLEDLVPLEQLLNSRGPG